MDGANEAHPKSAGASKGAGSTSTAGARTVYKLGLMSQAEIMALAKQHNQKLGLEDDVMAPVFRGAAPTFRPPAVHPFTFGDASRKDEYTAAWKSLARRVGIPVLSHGGLTAGAGAILDPRSITATVHGVAAGASEAAAAAVPAHRPTTVQAFPTHAEIYGTVDPPHQHVQFMEALGKLLGTGPIHLPLLAPGAPPLLLRNLFKEVHDILVRKRATSGDGALPGIESIPWPAVAQKLVKDEDLAGILKQVYEAYVLPVESRLPPGTRPSKAESWMAEYVRNREKALAERVAATAPEVSSRVKRALMAIQAYDPQLRAQQQQPGRSAAPDASAVQEPAVAAAAVAVVVADTEAGQAASSLMALAAVTSTQPPQAPAPGLQALAATAEEAGAAGSPAGAVSGTADAVQAATRITTQGMEGGAAPAAATAAAASEQDAAGPSRVIDSAAEGMTAAAGEAAPESPASGPPVRVASLVEETLATLQRAATRPHTLLPARPPAPSGSKRSKSSRRSQGSKKASRSGAGQKAAEEGAAGGGSGTGPSAAAGYLGGDGPDLTDIKASALLSIVASLRELRAGPASFGTQPPDLRAHFMQRWAAQQAARAAAAAATAAAAADGTRAASPAEAAGGPNATGDHVEGQEQQRQPGRDDERSRADGGATRIGKKRSREDDPDDNPRARTPPAPPKLEVEEPRRLQTDEELRSGSRGREPSQPAARERDRERDREERGREERSREERSREERGREERGREERSREERGREERGREERSREERGREERGREEREKDRGRDRERERERERDHHRQQQQHRASSERGERQPPQYTSSRPQHQHRFPALASVAAPARRPSPPLDLRLPGPPPRQHGVPPHHRRASPSPPGPHHPPHGHGRYEHWDGDRDWDGYPGPGGHGFPPPAAEPYEQGPNRYPYPPPHQQQPRFHPRDRGPWE